tara:strand:+ start:1562 stop:1789 length:228 start_codon:yes stop_codon:yes gene_type:complete
MEKETLGKLECLQYEISLEDRFLFERFRRTIEHCDDRDNLKHIATYFAKVATERNAIIKGLISELISPENTVLKS